ncbi:Transcription termination/antitermination protein NusA [Spiroplasma sp. JKS002671]|uniref:transcription termination factor NusA n=1 Tax=Spiroplasma attinicola TaxID=2904537 RepID=UPI002022A688|nr:transcription termination factor NusA [Spiroplasma sp. JKS002671]MCL8210283.1 Transcription termination/antitermination protein NusA [Spiroplasma sp. JKS002671]
MTDKNKMILEEIENIAKEKQIEPQVIYQALKEGLLKAYEKETHEMLDNVRVEIDQEQGKINMFKNLTVVAKVEEPDLEIALSQVKAENPESPLTIGDIYVEEIPTDKFGRLAISQAIQIFKQSIREAEKNSIYDEFIDKQGTILIGKVETVEDTYCLIKIGRAYAYLPKKNQILGETFSINEPNNHIKFYLEDIIKNKNYGQILASRSHSGFLSRLLELEVPEFNQLNPDGKNVIEIKEVARIPGVRAKVAIISNDNTIDAVGACIGPKGSRIQTISKELNGEKIDVILYDENISNFIINALAPAKVISISINEKEQQADVIVPTEQFSLAIGKNGMAAKLVARLTHWKINIISLEQAQKDNIKFNWNGNLKLEDYDQFVTNLRNKNSFRQNQFRK